jgi:hypothetical protein
MNRQRGDLYPGGWVLVDFLGPVELWRKGDDRYDVFLYLSPESVFKITEQKQLSTRSYRKFSQQRAMEMFSLACEMISHLPYEHQMNYYFHPYK